jgi:glycerol dehydrogenase-like iron-containing ADH family enzyme
LIAELPLIARRPYLIVTMDDLWDRFRLHFDQQHLNDSVANVYCVGSIEAADLDRDLSTLPTFASVIGLGGGQAIDVAKYFSWTRGVPLFQVPTALTVDAPFGHRAGLRFGGQVKYLGFAVPEAVYIDLDVIQQAPPLLNRSGICEVLCFHTARADWQLAQRRGRTEPQWPYQQHLVDDAQRVLDSVLDQLDEVRDVTETGIRTLVNAHQFGGATFHLAGWNPRPIEGVEHFVFYALEYLTGKKFIHGQPVCLGVYIGSLLHDDRADEMLDIIHRVGVDIRPEAMGLTWEQVGDMLRQLASFVRQAKLWYTIADEVTITDDIVKTIRNKITQKYGDWD